MQSTQLAREGSNEKRRATIIVTSEIVSCVPQNSSLYNSPPINGKKTKCSAKEKGLTFGLGWRDDAYATAMLCVVNAHQSLAVYSGGQYVMS